MDVKGRGGNLSSLLEIRSPKFYNYSNESLPQVCAPLPFRHNLRGPDVFIAFGLFLFYERSTLINSDTLRDELGLINALIRTVHDHARLGNRESPEAMDKAAEEARRALPPWLFDSGTDIFLHQLADSPSEEELRATVTELAVLPAGSAPPITRTANRAGEYSSASAFP